MCAKKKLVSKIETTTINQDSFDFPFYLSILFIMVFTYFVFSGAKDNMFVNWDDQVYVEDQPLVLKKEYNKLWQTPVSLNYHPVTMISLAMQVPKDIKKLSPKPFIILNVWLHIFNAILVFILIWLINEKKWLVALLSAVIFSIHPMHVESIVWISERKDVLYTMFFLISLISYWQYLEKNNKWWLVLTFVFFILSVLSKAMGVSLPLVLLLLDYWKGRNIKEYGIWIEKIPFLGVSLFFGLMAVSVQSGGDFGGILTLYGEKTKAVADAAIFTLWQRFQFASFGFVNYIIKFFLPIDICAFYPYPEGNKLSGLQGLFYPLIFLVISSLSIWSALKTRIFAFGIGFYLITIALVLQFVTVGLALMADRYTYIPYIGLSFLIVYSIDKWINSKSPGMIYVSSGALALFIIMLTIKTKTQVDVWQDSESLWTQVLKYYPKEDLALANRGNYRGKTGNIKGALEDFEVAIADGCERADVYEGLGNSYGTLSSQQPDKREEYVSKSILMYRRALELDPNKGNIHYNLGVSQLQTNPAASVLSFENALRLMPYKEVDILPVFGLALLNAGKYMEAIETITKAMTLVNPTDAMYYHRGLANIGAGNRDAAITDLQKSIAMNPNNQDAVNRLNQLKG